MRAKNAYVPRKRAWIYRNTTRAWQWLGGGTYKELSVEYDNLGTLGHDVIAEFVFHKVGEYLIIFNGHQSVVQVEEEIVLWKTKKSKLGWVWPLTEGVSRSCHSYRWVGRLSQERLLMQKRDMMIGGHGRNRRRTATSNAAMHWIGWQINWSVGWIRGHFEQ